MKLISFFRLPYCRRCSGKLWLWSLSDDNQPTLTGATRYLLYCFNRYTRKNSTFYLTFWNNWWDILITSLYVFCCWYRLYLRLVWKKSAGKYVKTEQSLNIVVHYWFAKFTRVHIRWKISILKYIAYIDFFSVQLVLN